MLAIATALLAQIDRPEAFDALRRGFQEECSNTHLIAVVGAVALLCGVLVVIWLCRRPSQTNVERVTHLAEGAHVLGLPQEDLDDLRTVAGRAAVSHPAAMLLSPANLARAARAARAAQTGGKTDQALQERLDRLARRLYGRSLAECEPPPPKRVS